MNGEQEAGMASPLPQELVDFNGWAIQDGRVVMEVFGAGDDSVQSQYSDQIVESSEEDADLGQRVESGDPRGVPSLGNGQFGPQTSARRYSAIHERKLAGDHADPIVDRSASIDRKSTRLNSSH